MKRNISGSCGSGQRVKEEEDWLVRGRIAHIDSRLLCCLVNLKFGYLRWMRGLGFGGFKDRNEVCTQSCLRL